MNIIITGINHKTAPIAVREKFFLTSTEQDLVLSELKCNPAVLEAFVLSTCNRTEIYVHVLEDTNIFPYLIKLLSDVKKIPFEDGLSQCFYAYTGKDAVEHLMQVSSGIDSLVLGEKQILGQVKKAVERSQEKKMLSKMFNVLTNIAIAAGKKAQDETAISFGGSSVSWAAIVMAEQQLVSLQDKSILIIGAGKMGELTASQIHNKGIGNIYLMNRTQKIADRLAKKYSGTAVPFCDIKETLSKVDVCVCSAGAPHYIIDEGILSKVMELRGDKELVLIDISMPRNIDPSVSEMKGIHLSDIDDLEKVVEKNMRIRQKAIADVKNIIEKKANSFYKKLEKIKELEQTGVSS